MARKTMILALAMAALASPVSAASEARMEAGAAPSGSATTKYCMRVEAFTGSVIEQVKCWTREQWSNQGVDVDRDWAANGVRTIG